MDIKRAMVDQQIPVKENLIFKPLETTLLSRIENLENLVEQMLIEQESSRASFIKLKQLVG